MHEPLDFSNPHDLGQMYSCCKQGNVQLSIPPSDIICTSGKNSKSAGNLLQGLFACERPQTKLDEMTTGSLCKVELCSFERGRDFFINQQTSSGVELGGVLSKTWSYFYKFISFVVKYHNSIYKRNLYCKIKRSKFDVSRIESAKKKKPF